MSIAGDVTIAVLSAAAVLADVRWLRVAQREHYLAGRVSRFAWRWWSLQPFNAPAALVAVAAAATTPALAPIGLVTAVVVAAGPLGLGLKGRTSKLNWTRRLRTLAAVVLLVEAALVVLGVLAGAGPLLAAGAAVAAPVLVDLALAATAPAERLLGRRFVSRANEKMKRIRPRVVAITGSYGKTSTKWYVHHLASATFDVLASPASYNNRNGLCRTVNDHLTPQTEVLVAEMGTYGPGEIAEMCRFVPPDIAVITAIGPVHLERFGSLDVTLAAKAEITDGAASVVLAVDDRRLAGLADRLESAGGRVVRASGQEVLPAGVSVIAAPGGTVLACHLDGELAGKADTGEEHRPGATSNVACAVAAALELGVPIDLVLTQLPTLPVPTNRLQVHRGQSGVTVLDDTYNSNPAGAELALGRLEATAESLATAAGEATAESLATAAGEESAPAGGQRVVVTPGMVELGREQAGENSRFAARCAEVATHVIVVGRTNRRPLRRGLAGATGRPAVVLVENRDQAVAWVREHLGEGDVVLYENDLPDHFP